MKKNKKLIGIVLTLTLIVTTVFAGAEATFATTENSFPNASIQVGTSTSTAIKLTSGDLYSFSGAENALTYYKIYSPSAGYLEVKFFDPLISATGYNISVINYKLKDLYPSNEYVSKDTSDNIRYVGVGKGTYYIPVSTGNTSYGIKVTHHAIKENSGSKKSTAKALTKGKYKSGIISAGQSATVADWYKLTIKKTQRVKLDLLTKTGAGGSFGGIRIELYRSKGNDPLVSSSLAYSNPTYTISQRLTPGTYYVKVSRAYNGNGYYKIKWLS